MAGKRKQYLTEFNTNVFEGDDLSPHLMSVSQFSSSFLVALQVDILFLVKAILFVGRSITFFDYM